MFHYLIECRRYSSPRKEIEKKLKQDAQSLRAMLSNPLATTTLVKYINETGRFREMGKGLEFTKEETEPWSENFDKKRKGNREKREWRKEERRGDEISLHTRKGVHAEIEDGEAEVGWTKEM